jgi:arginase family enzyme
MPYYGGLVSFFRSPAVEVEDVEEGMAVLAGVPIDNAIVTARQGARFGPRAIREWSMSMRHWYDLSPDKAAYDVDTEKGLRLKDKPLLGDFGDFNIDPINLERTTDGVVDGMVEIVKRGGFPVVLGGDHYVAYPSFEGFVKGFMERKEGARIGYIHIDSHSDFYDDFGGKFNHGTCVRRISENPHISYNNMAWVGLNKWLQADQVRLRRKHGLKMHTAADIRSDGIETVLKKAMEVAADSVDAVYVSVDIDVVDASQAPGTGAPVFEGIQAADLLEGMSILSEYDCVKAIDLSEVSPPVDPNGRTAYLAASGLIGFLGNYLFDVVDLDS